MNKIRIGVIGCGSIARHRHLPEYAALETVEITAVCDILEERAEEIASLYGAAAYTDYQDLISSGKVDAVSVCTPNYLHAPVSIAALKAGLNVLCEKPMATSKEDAEAMIAAEKESGKKLMIAHNQRFTAAHQKARKLIESGEMGKIYSFRTAFGHPGPEAWSVDGKDSWFFRKEEAFIGAMGDLGVHKTDLMRYLLGEEFTEVGAFVQTSAKTFGNVDDNAVCILKTGSGIVGTLAASWSYTGKEDNSTILYCENGIIRLEDDPVHSMVIQYSNGDKAKFELGKIQSNEEGGQVSSKVIDHFIACILEDKQPLVTGEEGKKSLQVILAALEANETKKIVSISQGVIA
ncbi:gfo/Idh/MocA family oxidoreductase [Bacillus sp. FJAT-42376]|uniref:Gfo/Idh/MocA family protein n=1 Tax=Bacillus sp. FJAT-42376 TaxID=2014076 RepID=UPI000F4F50B4|nr:Gfo/Idh/MocA family oxidoreductase [Bacillus sp. FJAT-42376]AZB42686.1 gfo/Idh/MocA family oxidoreductase [Bacillus sp. FJAT-42376]